MSRRASGLKAWITQRATALYLATFGVYVTLHFIFNAPADHAAMQDWVATPWVALGLILLIPIVLVHAWIGIRDVYMDYVKIIGLRVTALTLTGFIFIASGVAAELAIIVAQIA
ncbi:MAG TPA: succinate dehydrogenase, hydrophobic membrane anchor protein [Chromatiaceae bacterium]|jgi:succinate dehydrogenase / fumarate reductase membrane anchor subunit|nr:MAG: hypothetical protein N838_04965 [Thiohalocapsa sp. PB-PSB1]QQO55102.1 MAG: succinate dehydrogenase, hydrophobic membrane anchor protein [Thiohalocapsa sp. PB-PSB1]HBG96092.1 succinate dehydrogenase, hydrophobic membrane anchor protein [Chromatiaceae bacterium]HCS92390.1 succinate dehydrogenase, hydrophobic membrane anchor protein [Chromatiaceae bacterium]